MVCVQGSVNTDVADVERAVGDIFLALLIMFAQNPTIFLNVGLFYVNEIGNLLAIIKLPRRFKNVSRVKSDISLSLSNCLCASIKDSTAY